MKTIYLVRHGESIVNADKELYHGVASPLTERGRTQALLLADRARHLSFEALLSSPMARAKETAETIAAATAHSIEYHHVFREWRMPSSLDGKPRADRAVHDLAMRAIRARDGSGDKVEDSENFAELSARATNALQLLQDHPATSMLVVGHGYFTRVLIARMLYGEAFTSEIFKPLAWGLRTSNTGISMMQYDPDDSHRPWWLRVFNDHAHLG